MGRMRVTNPVTVPGNKDKQLLPSTHLSTFVHLSTCCMRKSLALVTHGFSTIQECLVLKDGALVVWVCDSVCFGECSFCGTYQLACYDLPADLCSEFSHFHRQKSLIFLSYRHLWGDINYLQLNHRLSPRTAKRTTTCHGADIWIPNKLGFQSMFILFIYLDFE